MYKTHYFVQTNMDSFKKCTGNTEDTENNAISKKRLLILGAKKKYRINNKKQIQEYGHY